MIGIIFCAFIVLVIINALEDGFRDRNQKVLAHIGNALHIAGWCSLMFINVEFSWLFVAQYVLIRFALFDVIWNLMNKQSLFYVGTTSLYDKFWRWFEKVTKWPLSQVLFWVKLISLLVAVSFLTY